MNFFYLLPVFILIIALNKITVGINGINEIENSPCYEAYLIEIPNVIVGLFCAIVSLFVEIIV